MVGIILVTNTKVANARIIIMLSNLGIDKLVVKFGQFAMGSRDQDQYYKTCRCDTFFLHLSERYSEWSTGDCMAPTVQPERVIAAIYWSPQLGYCNSCH